MWALLRMAFSSAWQTYMIFRVQRLALPLPRHGVVVAADGHAVVAQREDLVFRADDAGAHLTAGVFGAHGREQAMPMKYSSQLI